MPVELDLPEDLDALGKTVVVGATVGFTVVVVVALVVSGTGFAVVVVQRSYVTVCCTGRCRVIIMVGKCLSRRICRCWVIIMVGNRLPRRII